MRSFDELFLSLDDEISFDGWLKAKLKNDPEKILPN